MLLTKVTTVSHSLPPSFLHPLPDSLPPSIHPSLSQASNHDELAIAAGGELQLLTLLDPVLPPSLTPSPSNSIPFSLHPSVPQASNHDELAIAAGEELQLVADGDGDGWVKVWAVSATFSINFLTTMLLTIPYTYGNTT